MQDLMKGKRGLIMGVANDHSIAWGIAKAVAAQGAELAFTYQGEAQAKRVKPLAQSLGFDTVLPCDVEDHRQRRFRFRSAAHEMGRAGFSGPRHRLSDKNELQGPLCRHHARKFLAHHADLLLLLHRGRQARRRTDAASGGAMITLTFGGSMRAMPNYNVMGVAKAALEASVRYLAADFGPRSIRVNAISAGPVRTLAGAVIGDARAMFAFQQKHSPLGRGVTLDELGGSALYLLSDLSGGVTGEIHYVDSGYNIVLMPRPEHLKARIELPFIPPR